MISGLCHLKWIQGAILISSRSKVLLSQGPSQPTLRDSHQYIYIYIYIHIYRCISYRCLWKTHSFYVRLRRETQWGKLLSSPWFGTPKARLPTCFVLQRSVFFTDTGMLRESLLFRHRLNVCVPSHPGKHIFLRCMVSTFPRTAGEKHTRFETNRIVAEEPRFAIINFHGRMWQHVWHFWQPICYFWQNVCT